MSIVKIRKSDLHDSVDYAVKMIISADEDEASLPTNVQPGSIAFTADLTAIYILAADGETWTDVSESSKVVVTF